jgi:hypothetical protein
MATLNVIYKIAADISGMQAGVNRAADSMGRLEGMASTAGKVIGGMFTVGAVVAFGREVLNTADALAKLSDRTGIGAEALQRLEAVAEASGNTLDQVANAVNQFQNRLSSGAKGTAAAIQEIGLSVSGLQQLDPDEQFFAIAKAIAEIEDPATQTRIAMELFGKAGAQLLPTLKADVDALKDSTVVMSDESVKALDDLGDAMGRLLKSGKNILGELAGTIVRVGSEWSRFLANLQSGGALEQRVQQLGALNAALKAQPPTRAGVVPLPASPIDLDEALALLNAGLPEELDRVTAAAKRTTAGTRELAESIRALPASGARFGTFVEQIRRPILSVLPTVTSLADALTELGERPMQLPQVPLPSGGPSSLMTAEKDGPNPFATIFDGVPEIMAQAMAASGKIENALRAMAAKVGAQLGKMIGSVFGELGGKIGEQVGSMLGYVAEKMWDAFTTSSGEDVARRIGQNWGIRITEAMGDQIAKDAAEMFNGSRQAAELWNMGRLFELDPENLGITPRNFEQAVGKLHDIFSMIETDQMTVAQGAKVIDDNWSDMVAAGTDSFGFISGRLKEIIDLDRRFGTQSKEIAKFLDQQADAAVRASNDVIASIGEMVEGWKRLKAAGVSLSLVAHTNKQELEDLGLIAVATFGAAIAAGKSFAEALALASPGLAQLSDAFKTLGIDTDNAALRVLMLQSTILQRNPSLIQGVAGLGSAFVALSNMGMLNVDTFNALSRTGAQMYARIQGEVAALGGTTVDALLPMQDYLHKAEEAARQLGIPLDENTQMLIDQSKELGIWKETGKTANEKMLEGIGALIAKMDEFITRITGGLYPAIDNIPDPHVTGTVDWHVEPIPNVDMPEINARMPEPIPMADGGDFVVRQPTLFMAGEAGAERATFTPLGRASSPSGSGGVVVNISGVTVVASENDDPLKVQAVFLEALRTKGPLYEAIGTVAQRAVA